MPQPVTASHPAFAEKPQVSGGRINGGYFVFEREFLSLYLDDRDNLSLEAEPLQRLANLLFRMIERYLLHPLEPGCDAGVIHRVADAHHQAAEQVSVDFRRQHHLA